MSNLTRYFENKAYQPTWFIGDRVQGKWNRIPFVGTVGNDTVISEIAGPRVSVHLELPIKFKHKIHNVVFVKPNDLKEYQ